MAWKQINLAFHAKYTQELRLAIQAGTRYESKPEIKLESEESASVNLNGVRADTKPAIEAA